MTKLKLLKSIYSKTARAYILKNSIWDNTIRYHWSDKYWFNDIDPVSVRVSLLKSLLVVLKEELVLSKALSGDVFDDILLVERYLSELEESRNKQTNKCPNCGGAKNKTAKLCMECHKAQRKVGMKPTIKKIKTKKPVKESKPTGYVYIGAQDLMDSNKVVQGGAPGTGKRR